MKDGLESTHIMVPVELYKELMRSQNKLDALEAGGVDNWDGYEAAMEGPDEDGEIEGLDEDGDAEGGETENINDR